MQHMTKIMVPVELTYDGSATVPDVQAMVANVLELARIDGRLSTEQMGEVGCTSVVAQYPQVTLYTLYTGFSEVHDAFQKHLSADFESLWKSITDNDRCTLAVYHNRVDFRAGPTAPLITIFNKPTGHFTL